MTLTYSKLLFAGKEIVEGYDSEIEIEYGNSETKSKIWYVR